MVPRASHGPSWFLARVIGRYGWPEQRSIPPSGKPSPSNAPSKISFRLPVGDKKTTKPPESGTCADIATAPVTIQSAETAGVPAAADEATAATAAAAATATTTAAASYLAC